MLNYVEELLTFWDQDTQSRRNFRRWMVELSALIKVDGETHYCTIKDISPRGAHIVLIQDIALSEGAEIAVDIEGYGTVVAKVRQAKGGTARLMFLHREDGEEDLADWLTWLNPQRKQRRYACKIEARLSVLDHEYPCTVINLSRRGAAIKMTDTSKLTVSSDVALSFADYGIVSASVRHIDGDTVGLILHDGYLGDLPPRGPQN